MKAQRKLKCPECGAEMNRHAVKVIQPRTMEEALAVNDALGGIVEDMHTCPACGRGASERREGTPR